MWRSRSRRFSRGYWTFKRRTDTTYTWDFQRSLVSHRWQSLTLYGIKCGIGLVGEREYDFIDRKVILIKTVFYSSRFRHIPWGCSEFRSQLFRIFNPYVLTFGSIITDTKRLCLQNSVGEFSRLQTVSLVVSQGLALMVDGFHWRVGSRISIHVWSSHWIPRPLTFQSITLVSTNASHLLVAILIDHELGVWNYELIKNIFLLMDVECILAIPLGRTNQTDLAVCVALYSGAIMELYLDCSSSPEEFQRHSLRRKILVGCEVGSSLRPPGARWVKINFDGAVFMDGVEGGCRIMAHSKFGKYVA
ncbi:hypothetical protein Sango_0386100 [Sesamum angolense]|uniref:Uncharacterized protein n=1 Tax=Sesamum angolense TaxID=2727404 RepID=A0AAE2C3U8_9LAMI|nr:hypothetical protein Sango_0386100 [Sesamum angolense]